MAKMIVKVSLAACNLPGGPRCTLSDRLGCK